MSTNQELFVLEAGDKGVTADIEKYFFRCWARYRQLIPLLDKKLPDGIGPMLTERFQVKYFSRKMFAYIYLKSSLVTHFRQLIPSF